jgi:hypothetical protein
MIILIEYRLTRGYHSENNIREEERVREKASSGWTIGEIASYTVDSELNASDLCW